MIVNHDRKRAAAMRIVNAKTLQVELPESRLRQAVFGSAFDRDLITPVVPRPARWIAWTLPMEQDGSLPNPGLTHSSEDRFDEALSLTVATPPMVGWALQEARKLGRRGRERV